jgi:hypothetical protein
VTAGRGPAELRGVLKAADMFQVDGLLKHSLEALEKGLTAATAVEGLVWAHMEGPEGEGGYGVLCAHDWAGDPGRGGDASARVSWQLDCRPCPRRAPRATATPFLADCRCLCGCTRALALCVVICVRTWAGSRRWRRSRWRCWRRCQVTSSQSSTRRCWTRLDSRFGAYFHFLY